MIFVTNGVLTVVSNGVEYPVSNGQLCLIPAGTEHATELEECGYSRWLMFIEPWEFSRLYFSPRLNALLTGMLIKEPMIMDFPYGEEMFRMVQSRLSDTDNFSEDLITAEIIRMLSTVGEKNNLLESFVMNDAVKTVMNVQQYIYQNSSQQLRMGEVSERFFTNKFYLTHIFKEYTGMSPKSFQINCRINNAERLIRTSSETISKISEKCGFVSLSDLTGRFKQRFGCTPAEYRKNKNRAYW